jgi:hypothetical protein
VQVLEIFTAVGAAETSAKLGINATQRMIPSGFLWIRVRVFFARLHGSACRRAMPRLSLTRLYQPILRHNLFQRNLSVTPSWGGRSNSVAKGFEQMVYGLE